MTRLKALPMATIVGIVSLATFCSNQGISIPEDGQLIDLTRKFISESKFRQNYLGNMYTLTPLTDYIQIIDAVLVSKETEKGNWGYLQTYTIKLNVKVRIQASIIKNFRSRKSNRIESAIGEYVGRKIGTPGETISFNRIISFRFLDGKWKAFDDQPTL